jgi:MoaE-MoaD fusion protein
MGARVGTYIMHEEKIQVKLLFFATLKEIVNKKDLVVLFPTGKNIRFLKEFLISEYPQLSGRLSYALCSYNHEYVNDEQLIENNAEIGFFPPVSGGSDEENDTILLTEARLDLDLLLKTLTTKETGAACIFTGFVRGETERGNRHKTIKLEYESYLPMAELKMRQICTEIHEHWPQIKKIYMVQRLGTLEPGAVTTVIGCSSGHRDEGIFEAARYGIDRMKEIVPVWKKEIGTNGSEWVEGKYKPGPGE